MHATIHNRVYLIFMACCLMLSGCTSSPANGKRTKPMKIGIMLSEVGLGDQSYSDAAFRGLMRARDELGILFDYREVSPESSYEQGLLELAGTSDLVISVGFPSQEAMEKVARRYPELPFILIDATSQLPNVVSLTFDAEEGSYLAGIVAGLKTKTGIVGFVGGTDAPYIRSFAGGYERGVLAANPKAKVLRVYGNSFGDIPQGARLAKGVIQGGADVVYAAAGMTGVGVLRQAEADKLFSIGVDSDQYYLAEKSVLTSMLKNVDVGIFGAVQEFVKDGSLKQKNIHLGLKENGVSLAPLRLSPFTPEEKQVWDRLTEGMPPQFVSTGDEW